MTLLFGILMCISATASQDTLRKDGYYMKVTEQGTIWNLMYFSPDGSYVDSTGEGTPPVFEGGMLKANRGVVYSVQKEKDGFIIRLDLVDPLPYHVSNFPIEMKCMIEKKDLVILAWKDGRDKKWKKGKERYF